jgi:hypothetical protein
MFLGGAWTFDVVRFSDFEFLANNHYLFQKYTRGAGSVVITITPLEPPYCDAGDVVVNFPGLEVILEVNYSGNVWQSLGVFTDYAELSVRDGNALLERDNVRVRARMNSNIWIISNTVTFDVGKGFVEVDIPLRTMEVTGFGIQGLNMAVRQGDASLLWPAIYHNITVTEEDVEFNVFDNGQLISVVVGGLGFESYVRFNIANTYDISDLFYEIEAPEGVVLNRLEYVRPVFANLPILAPNNGEVMQVMATGQTVALYFTANGVGSRIEFVLDGTCPFEEDIIVDNSVTVNFAGMKNIQLEYRVGNGAWIVLPGTFDDNAVLELPPGAYAFRARTTQTAPNISAWIMSSTVQAVVSGNGPVVVDIPVRNITVTGIALPGLNITVRNGITAHNYYHITDHNGTVEFTVFENGTTPNVIIGGNMGYVNANTRNFDIIDTLLDVSGIFYPIALPENAIFLTLNYNRTYLGMAHLPITVPINGNVMTVMQTSEPVILRYMFDGMIYSMPFYLDGENPFANWEIPVWEEIPIYEDVIEVPIVEDQIFEETVRWTPPQEEEQEEETIIEDPIDDEPIVEEPPVEITEPVED